MVATYEYDAFGGLRAKTGVADTDFRFTGEQWDSESGFYYLRARYYDPAIGRFVSRDPLMGFASAPQTLTRYAYVLNNPVNWIDPWGLRNLEGTAFATRTPTPVGAITVCGPARHDVCENPQLVVPPSGGRGIDWGDVARAYWEYHPYHLTYRYVLAPAWDFATTRTPRCYIQAAGLAIWTTILIATTPEGAPLWSGPLQYGPYQTLAIRTGAACSVTR